MTGHPAIGDVVGDPLVRPCEQAGTTSEFGARADLYRLALPYRSRAWEITYLADRLEAHGHRAPQPVIEAAHNACSASGRTP